MTAPSMPHDAATQQPPAAPAGIVLGVDTHKDIHVAAVVALLGALLGSRAFPATAAANCWPGPAPWVIVVRL
jgi:transposase